MPGDIAYHSDCAACVAGEAHTLQQHTLNRIDAALARMRARMVADPSILGAISIANLEEKRKLVEADNFVVRPADAETESLIRWCGGQICQTDQSHPA
ncbi:MAG: hypothetical protein KJ077_11040 [Anaerolineae bacterium]|nr:hypothetical protein [Anaerolineae bacterium]